MVCDGFFRGAGEESVAVGEMVSVNVLDCGL